MKVRGWIDTALQGTHNHYLCYLPGNIGFLSSWILKLLFSGIKADKSQLSILQKIPKDAIVVYTVKHKSYFEYLFYYTRYKQAGLLSPEIGFDHRVFVWQPVSRIFRILLAHIDYICQNLALPDPYSSGYIKQELIKGRSGFLALIDKKGFYRRFVKKRTDPIRYLIEMQKSIDRPIFIVPQLMFFSKKPYRSTAAAINVPFGAEEKPGKMGRIAALFKSPGKVFVEISDPVNLKYFLELAENRQRSTEYQALVLRRNLLTQINRHRQSITGPVLKSMEELKEDILTGDRLRDFMEHYSEKRNVSIQKVRKDVNAYIEEIAARYNITLIKVFEVVAKWLFNTMFEGVAFDNDELNRVKSMSQKGPLIFVPCHRSHIDYLILSYTLHTNNMPCPHIAAGKNLSFWPLGPIFRGSGAFFIRRSFKGAALYSKVFTEYIYKLLEEGFNIEFFIEGGRSRTGKMILPKLGFLSILLNAYKNKACDDMIFVPVFIGYDRVLEESSYLNELEGGQKRPESFMQVIKARKYLKKRYGRIYIRFHEPISLNEPLKQFGSSIDGLSSKEFNALCRNLGHRVINAINSVSVVTPHAIVASAIMNSSKKVFSYNYLMFQIETYMAHLLSQKATLADTLSSNHVYAVEQVLDAYIQRKFIEHSSTGKETGFSDRLFKINESKRLNLEYYKNNCIAFFIPAAFTALAILEKDAFRFSASTLHSAYGFLQDFFKNEFAHDIEKTPEYFVRKNLKMFIDDNMLTPHPTLPDTYEMTSTGLKKLKLFSSFLKVYFESYWIVLNFFMQYPQNSIKAKERLKKIESIGNRMYKEKETERREALSRINYENAVDFFTTHGVKGSDNNEKIKFYADVIQKYLNCLSA